MVVSEQETFSIWIGYDPRELDAFAVAVQATQRRSTPIPVYGLVLDRLRHARLYTRQTEIRVTEEGARQLYDVISQHPMATEFAISRFLVPHLATKSGREPRGWALFMDCDMLPLPDADFNGLFEKVSQTMGDRAVVCVKHSHISKSDVKMDGQVQVDYPYKNWSSFMLFNLGHPANKALTVDLVNSVPGRDLHAFCWLPVDKHEALIGELPVGWNWLVGHSPSEAKVLNVHFTDGVPSMAGYHNEKYAENWRQELERWSIVREYPRFMK